MDNQEQKEWEKYRDSWHREKSVLEACDGFPTERMLDAVRHYAAERRRKQQVVLRQGAVVVALLLLAGGMVWMFAPGSGGDDSLVAQRMLSSDSVKGDRETEPLLPEESDRLATAAPSVPVNAVTRTVPSRAKVRDGQLPDKGESLVKQADGHDSTEEQEPFYEVIFCNNQCDTLEVLSRLAMLCDL